jgi:hypothetical protein
MSLNVNVATFIPKPHTPYERAAQLGERDALDAINRIRSCLHGSGFKIGYHAPLLSLLEGIVSRGDERAGAIVLEAYRRGARLDAWEEYLQADTWRSVIADASWDVAAETCRARTPDERLPWHDIGLALSQSEVHEPDTAPAGPAPPARPAPRAPGESARVLFRFSKRGRAVWISHLDLMTVLERSMVRAGYRARFTEGFNPKPRLEFASPLALGAESAGEIASIELDDYDGPGSFAQRMNRALPEGIVVDEATPMPPVARGSRRPSLGACYWGSEYRVGADRVVLLPKEGPGIKSIVAEAGGSVSVERLRTFAAGPGGQPVSYFEAFRSSSLS